MDVNVPRKIQCSSSSGSLYYFSQSLETCFILRINVSSALKVVLWVKICLNMNNFLGSIERKFPSSSFPNAKEQAKKSSKQGWTECETADRGQTKIQRASKGVEESQICEEKCWKVNCS